MVEKTWEEEGCCLSGCQACPSQLDLKSQRLPTQGSAEQQDASNHREPAQAGSAGLEVPRLYTLQAWQSSETLSPDT